LKTQGKNGQPKQIGKAMIKVTQEGFERKQVESADIIQLSK
jgi:hypothetical protein